MSTTTSTEGWSRKRLLALMIGVLITAVLLLFGMGLAVTNMLTDRSTIRPGTIQTRSFPVGADGVRGDAYRDALAAEPMLQANASDLKPAPAALDEQGVLLVGPPHGIGPVGVTTGYPHTESGALEQLAAIEIAVLTPMTLANAHDVFNAWAVREAHFNDWELAASIRSFHAAAGTTGGDSEISVVANPVGAQIKGTDGPDWVLACVQLDLTIRVVNDARFGFGHCSRMQWQINRWLIAPGTPPAQAPSTWPGSQRSVDAGWLRWVERGDS